MKYRKKAVVIEAFELGAPTCPDWFEDALKDGTVTLTETGAVINTLEGPMNADTGDYILQGVRGEIYSCKADIFKETYEEAE